MGNISDRCQPRDQKDDRQMELLQHRHALCWQLENRRVHLAGVKESHTSAGADLARVQAEVFDSYTWQTTCLDTLQTRVEKYQPILRRAREEAAAVRRLLCADLGCPDQLLDDLLLCPRLDKAVQATDQLGGLQHMSQRYCNGPGKGKVTALENILRRQAREEVRLQGHMTHMTYLEDARLAATLRRRGHLKMRLYDLREQKMAAT